jgi:competence protein ComEC
MPHSFDRFDFHDGDRVEIVGSLERASGLSNPGQDAWAQYLARRGVWSEMHARRLSAVRLLPGGQPNWFRSAAWAARSALLRSLRAILPRTDAAVLAGVLLGLRTDLPSDLLAAFVATGTIHILATAGLHVGILYKIVLDAFSCFSWLTVPRKAAAAGTIAVLWLYDLMAGGRIAVTRAVIMATIYLASVILERSPDVLNSLGGAALAVLAFSPGQLLDAGFQASFAAVLMIALMMPVWDRLWERVLSSIRARWPRLFVRRALELAGLTLFAQTGAAPVIAHAFNVLALAGSVANLVVVPVLFYLIPAGLAIAIMGVWLHGPAAVLGHLMLSPALRFIVAVVTGAAAFPGASTVIVSPPLVRIAAYFAIAVFVFFRAEGWLWRLRLEARPKAAV